MSIPTSPQFPSIQPTRRRFLQGSLAALAGLGLTRPVTLAGPSEVPAALRGQAKNIIFCVSDGMSAGVLSMAEEFSRLQRGRGTAWIALQNEEGTVAGLMETYSLNSLVTDSAAASSAWGSGHRVNNRTINILPDGTILEPIARRFRQAAKKVGVVTTATVTHATPAGFVANVESRRSEDEIARQYLDRIDLALGGGAKFFDPATREDRADLFADYQKAGFAVARSAGELAQVAQPGARVLGVFAPDHLPYSIDQRNDKNLESSVPSLADMTKAALNCLAGQGEGFLLQVEGARIDHAAHHNDIATLLWEQLAFDDAVQVSLDFARENGDTLLIVTTDHGNSNPGLNGMGPDYTDSTRCFERIGQARESFFALEQWACKQLADGRLTAPRWAEMMQQATGLEPTPAEADILFAAVAGASEGSLNKQLANFWGLMGQITGNHTGVGWCGTTHTADPAILHARGPGASAFHGWVQNFEVCGRLCALAGVVSPSAPA